MVKRWSLTTSNFYSLIGQNLTGEFMRKIYAACWKLFTLTAEADSVLGQLVVFNCLFPLDSGELRNGAKQIWRGVVCFSRDFTFRINILNLTYISHKDSFFIITNVLSLSRDLPHPFLTFYFNPNLHHFINNTCNLIHFLSMTIDTKFMELIGVFLNYLRFVNYNVSC